MEQSTMYSIQGTINTGTLKLATN